VKQAIVEPLSLSPTLGQDPHSPFPLVTAKNFLGKQLADFSRARFDGSEGGGDPITLGKQGCYVHSSTPNQEHIHCPLFTKEQTRPVSSQGHQLQAKRIAFAFGCRRLNAARQLRPDRFLVRGEHPSRRQSQLAPCRLEGLLNHGLQVGFDGRAGKRH
jgi:hypothetical protein